MSPTEYPNPTTRAALAAAGLPWLVSVWRLDAGPWLDLQRAHAMGVGGYIDFNYNGQPALAKRVGDSCTVFVRATV